jgi:broad specificity phosphatase PhoE
VTRLYLVRHGHAAAAWGDGPDPGLDDLGRGQAEAVAAHLVTSIEPVPVVSSPRARARETAEPLARRWGRAVEVVEAFDEVPSPTDHPDGPRGRQAWLRAALAGRWSDLDERVQRWRAGLVEAVASRPHDAVVCTHFVAINSLVAHATADDQVTVFLPANGSITELEVNPETGAITVATLGTEARSDVG